MVIVALLGLTGALITVTTADANAADGTVEVMEPSDACRDVVFIGARGSGQKFVDADGLGSEVQFARDEYVSQLPLDDIGYYAVRYEADPVNVFGLITSESVQAEYFASIDGGVRDVLYFLNERQWRCPGEHYVLSGYSQGAMVMHRVLDLIASGTSTLGPAQAILPMIDGVIAIADGDRTKKNGGLPLGTAKEGSGVGAMQAASLASYTYGPSLARIPDYSWWTHTRFIDVCQAKDAVCDFTHIYKSAPLLPRSFEIHGTSYGSEGAAAGSVSNAADVVADVTEFRLRADDYVFFPAGEIGQYYHYDLAPHVSGGAQPYEFKTAWPSDLPDGLTLKDGIISGIPMDSVPYDQVKLEVTDQEFQVAILDGSITITDPSIEEPPTDPPVDLAKAPVVSLVDVASISVGDSHACATTNGGDAHCWGAGTVGQLGDGGMASSSRPVLVAGLSNVVSVSAGGSHSCAVTSNGEAYCWGGNAYGQLGTGTTVGSPSPQRVIGLPEATAIVAGGMHSCASTRDRLVYCWGDNDFGQIGDNTYPDSPLPQLVKGLSSGTSLTAGSRHSGAVGEDNTGYVWGFLAIGSEEPLDLTRAVPLTSYGEFLTISGGWEHACGTAPDGTARCWGGGNWSGELGNGQTGPESVGYPGQPLQLPPVMSIAAGWGHSCAVTTSGDAYCWGQNLEGLDQGISLPYELSPVLVKGLPPVAAIEAGQGFSCALGTDRAVYCWGWNQDGQLGTGAFG